MSRTSDWLAPALRRSALVLLVMLPVLLLLAIPRRTRLRAALWLRIHAALLGILVWLYALLFTLQVWGWIPVIVGIALFGVGLLPIAMLAALVTNAWTVLASLLAGLLVAGGTRAAARFVRATALPSPPVSREIDAEYQIHE